LTLTRLKLTAQTEAAYMCNITKLDSNLPPPTCFGHGRSQWGQAGSCPPVPSPLPPAAPTNIFGFCKCPHCDNVALQTAKYVFIVKTHNIYKLSRIHIACILNDLNCKLTDIVAGYSIHQICIRFIVSNTASALHSHRLVVLGGVGRISSTA